MPIAVVGPVVQLVPVTILIIIPPIPHAVWHTRATEEMLRHSESLADGQVRALAHATPAFPSDGWAWALEPTTPVLLSGGWVWVLAHSTPALLSDG